MPIINKAKIPVSSNKLIKHMAAGEWDTATTLLRQDKTLAQGRSPCPGFFGDGKTSDIFPIHQAIASHAPICFLEELIAAYPKCVNKEESAYRRTSLHIACRNRSSGETVSLLLRQNKEAAAHQDNMGRIPLHYALSNGGSLELVQTLLEASPISVSATDRAGWSPLHVACNQEESFDVIEALVKADPDGVILRTNCGSSPVILAEKAESPDKEIILELLRREEHRVSKKTEFVRIRNAEKKLSQKQKAALTIRKVAHRHSVRGLV